MCIMERYLVDLDAPVQSKLPGLCDALQSQLLGLCEALQSLLLGVCEALQSQPKSERSRAGQSSQHPRGLKYFKQKMFLDFFLWFSGQYPRGLQYFKKENILQFKKEFSCGFQVKHWMDPQIIPYGWGLFSEGEEVRMMRWLRRRFCSHSVGNHSILVCW